MVNQGTILADNGTMRLAAQSVDSTAGVLAVASGATLEQSTGTVTAQTVNVASGGSYSLTGGRFEANTFNGNFSQTGGTFAAGVGTAAGVLNGNYALGGGGVFELDLAGHTSGLFDQLKVSGNVSLAGSLNIVPQAGFSVTAGDYFDFLQVGGSRSGLFSGRAEGSTVTLGGQTLYLTYNAGAGYDVALVSALTPGSVNFLDAHSTDVGYVAGTRDAPSGSAPSQIALKGLDVLAGSSFTLGGNETLNLDGGSGTLHVSQGAVLNANGIVQGSISNAGLVRIPLAEVAQVTGGHVVIPAPAAQAGGSPAAMVSSNTVPVNAGTLVGFTGASGGSSGGVSSTPVYTMQAPAVTTQGTFAVDASLEISGTYTQASTGALRLFVGGDHAADFTVSRTGGDYSQLFVDGRVGLDGVLQIVLRPELFAGNGYTPKVGDTFDFVTGLGGISLLSGLKYEFLVSTAGADLLHGLSWSAYSSGISSDPDSLYLLSGNLFRFDLVDGGTVLRGTLLAALFGASSQVPAPSTLWLLGAGLLGWAARLGRRPA